MNASARFFSFVIMFFFGFGIFVQGASARPDRKKGICYFLTSRHLTPKQFAREYDSEKKENARMLERSHRKMACRRHGWSFFQFRAENHREANPTHFH